MAFDAELIPKNLIDQYNKKHCGLLVGAGASAGAGMPLWNNFLEKLTQAALDNKTIGEERAAEYTKLIGDHKFLPAASGLKEDLGPYFDDLVTEIFVRSKPEQTDLHKAFLKLEHLQFVLTTNYDTLLERAWREKDPDVSVCTYKNTGEVRRGLSAREFFILKAHGDASRVGDGIILTEKDYRQVLFKEPAYQNMLATMFSMYTIVFVGASMNDPEIGLMLNYIASTFTGSAGPTHYAALTKEQITEIEQDRWFKDFNVKVIPVSSDNEYQELTEFVEELAKTG